MSWYKDRDFPELKREVQGEPGEILAVIPKEEDLLRVITAHEEEINALKKYYEEQVRYLNDRLAAEERSMNYWYSRSMVGESK